jgi:chromate transport protein ChrA
VIPAATLAFLFLLFPTGHVRSRRWRLAAWFSGGAFALAAAWLLIAASQLWAHPFTSSSPETGPNALLRRITGLLTSAALVSVAALVVRFVKSSGEERLQLKWFTAAALLVAVPFLTSAWVNSAAVIVLQSLACVCLWTAVAIAVLKYRLYDIDRIISRTLAYAVVTGLLV